MDANFSEDAHFTEDADNSTYYLIEVLIIGAGVLEAFSDINTKSFSF